MDEHPLHTLLNPRSVAMVGVSANLTKMGTIQYLNLIHSGYRGTIYLVHPETPEILGRNTWPDPASLPEVPDLAVLVVPTAAVSSLLREFGERGTRHAVVITAGFRETGETGREREEEIHAVAREYGIRFLGPNCFGIVNTHLPLNMTVVPFGRPQGILGIASQSGTYISQILPYVQRHGIAVSKALSVGNEADLDLTDCLTYLGRDPQTRAIGLYIEGLKRPRDFLDAAREITPHKPVVAQYVGGTAAGARSGSSHTGAMAGPDDLYDGLFEQAGIIRVPSIEEVFRLGWALATQPPLRGRRIAVLTNSGGPGTAIADTCARGGLEVNEFSPPMQARIRELLPGHASSRNPVDLTFHVGLSSLVEDIPEIMFSAEEVDGVIIHGVMDTGFMEAMYPIFKPLLDISAEEFIASFESSIDELVGLPASWGKPLVISTFVGDEDHCTRVLHENLIPKYDSPEMAGRAMGALWRYWSTIHGRPRDAGVGCREGRRLRELLAAEPRPDEYAAKRLLETCGITVTREARVNSVDEALESAGTLGYPVVCKACTSDIAHKTEQGLVFTGLNSPSELKKACARIHDLIPEAELLIAEHIQSRREFIVGMTRRDDFGPVLLFGVGGVNAEGLRDTVLRLAPLSRSAATAMIRSIRSADLLGPFRGEPGVDVDRLADLIVALGDLAMEVPGIKEIDCNPVMVVRGLPVVADCLIVMEEES